MGQSKRVNPHTPETSATQDIGRRQTIQKQNKAQKNKKINNTGSTKRPR